MAACVATLVAAAVAIAVAVPLGTTRPYTLEIIGDNGLFKGGKAAQLTFSAACSFLCSEYFAEQTIQLKGGRK